MKAKERILRAVFLSAFFFLVLFACRKNVSADMTPKPSIDLKVLNAPKSDFYIAVLGRYGDAPNTDSELKIDGEVNEESSMEYLESFSYEGWTFHKNPLNGTFSASNDNDEYHFHYYEVPTDFRVIIITSAGEVYLSPSYSKKEFNAKCTYDFATREITEETESKDVNRFLIIVSCLIATLIVEMLVFLIFRFPLKKGNIISVLLINLLTNPPLNFLVLQFSVLFVSVPAFEVAIIVFESLMYFLLLRNKEGKKTPMSIFYGVCANIASAVIGYILMIIIYLIS